MAHRISLREFQEQLAQRLAHSQEDERRSLLAFEAGNQRWLIDLADTHEVLPVPPLSTVPLSRNWFRGLANVRGTLYGIVDWSRFHEDDAIGTSGAARIVLLHARHGVGCGLLVSRTSGLRSADDFTPDTSKDEASRPWISAVMRDDADRPWLHMDVARLIRQPEFLDAGRGSR